MEEQEHTSAPVRLLHEAAVCDADDGRFGILVTLNSAAAHGRILDLWFSSVSTFSWFLVDAFPELFCEEQETEELQENLSQLMPVLREEGLTEAILQELNEYIGAWATMQWLGTFDDACAGDTEPTKLLVELFRADRRQDGDEPVDVEEREDFAEFLTAVNDL